MRALETLINEDHQDDGRPRPVLKPYPREVYQLSTVLASIPPTLEEAALYDSLQDRSETSKFKSSIGSTNGKTRHLLVEDDYEATEPSTNNDFLIKIKYILDDLYAKATKVNIYLDDIMVSAAHVSRHKGIDASHLSKIWIIDLDSVKRTLEFTSHHSKRNDNPTLSRNYGTNDRMLRYKRIKEKFFIDALFSA